MIVYMMEWYLSYRKNSVYKYCNYSTSFLFYQWVWKYYIMKEADFIFLFVNIYLQTAIEATIAIESYCNSTIPNFYEGLLSDFNEALKKYQEITKENREQYQEDAMIEAYLLNCRDKVKERTIKYIRQRVFEDSCIQESEIDEIICKVFEQKNSKNPFITVIKEIRCKENEVPNF